MRIVFMGTSEFAVPALEKLARSEYQVVAVYTQPDRPAGRGQAQLPSPVKKAALKYSLSVLQPIRLREPAEVERVASLKPDLMVVAAFGQILPQNVLDIPEFGCLNIHPSLLPRYRGASPIPAAILAGDEHTGVTIMALDAGMDTGPIISQVEAAIGPGDTTGTLTFRLAHLGAELLLSTLPAWFGRKIKARSQDEARASYSAPLSKAEGQIDWGLDAEQIWRRVRAFNPWPTCYTWWQGRRLKILEAAPSSREGKLVPGIVMPLEAPAAIGVETGKGVLALGVVQLEGKRALSGAEFLNGHKDIVGAVLGS